MDPSFNATTTDLTGTTDPTLGFYYSTKVSALTVQPDGKIIIGGKFDQVDGLAAKNLARLNADGSLDTTFTGDDTVGVVASQALQFDGKLVVGGSTGLARLYAYTPVTTSAATASGMVGKAFTYQITASNEPTNFAASSLPDGLSLDPATGLISGTPVQAGTFYVTLSTLDAAGASTGTGPLTLTIASAIPVISSATMAPGMVGQPFTYLITASSSPTSYAAAGLPDGLTLDASSGVISGTPTTVGTFTVNLSATNDGGMGTGTLTLTIAPNVPVISSAAAAQGMVGQPFTYAIMASGSPTQYTATGLPGGLTLNTSSGVISGTPTTAGIFTVNLSAANSGATGMSTLTITVVPAVPIVASAAATGMVGEPLTYQITASGSPTVYTAAGLPGGLTLDTSSGVISGVPTTVGIFTVNLSATNNGGTGTGVLTLSIAPMTPVATLVATIPAVTTATDNIGEFTLSLSPTPTVDTVVNFKIMGTAVDGTDYVFLKATKKIKAGSTGKPIKVVPLGNGGGAGVKHTVVLTLQPGTGYTVGTTGKVKVRIYGQ